MFDAVIFDCDGVLVDSEILYIEAEIALLAEHGLAYEPGDYKGRFLGLHHSAYFPALDADVRERFGVPLPSGFREALYDRYAKAYPRMAAVPGAFEAVSALARPVAVASSSDEAALRRKLTDTGLIDLFDPHVYSADRVGRGKPDPDVFVHAAERLGVAPRGCLVLEDSVNGVLAGRAAGMAVWGFSGGGHMDAEAAGRLVEAGAERIVGAWPEAEALWRELALA